MIFIEKVSMITTKVLTTIYKTTDITAEELIIAKIYTVIDGTMIKAKSNFAFFLSGDKIWLKI
jgi:hypothetical protein